MHPPSAINSTAKNRYVFVGPSHPYRGGIAHFIEHLAAGLQARGGESHFVTFTRQYPEFLFPGKTQLSDGQGPPDISTQRTLDTINPITWNRTGQLVGKLQPDVVVFKYWMSFFAPSFAQVAAKAKKAGARVVVVVDNALPHERRPGDLLLARHFLRKADGLITMSRKVKQDVESVVGVDAPVVYIPHPVYDNFGEPMDRGEAREMLRIDRSDKMLLFFGFIRKYKGLDVLLDAMPAVLSQLPDTKLVVAGEFYGDEAAYRDRVKRLDIESVVRFESDYIPDDAVGRYFSACDLVVQPYRNATQSGVAQIAFQFDRPVVVTDVGGLSEIVPDGKVGFVVPPENAAALADAIVRFFRDDRAADMTRAVRIEKEKYSWDRMYETIESFARTPGGGSSSD
ncbi:MAG: glycosyltransferase [Bacteroidetes bacterium]|nr:glycosyltransferase [Bacteroidota bacterium]